MSTSELATWFRAARKVESYRTGIKIELLQLRIMALGIYFDLSARLGNLNQSEIAWISAELKSCPPHDDRDEYENLLAGLSNLGQIGLQAYTASVQGLGVSIAEFQMPFTNENMDLVKELPADQQTLLFAVMKCVAITNSKISEMHQWTMLSVQVVGQASTNAVRNADASMKVIHGQMRRLIERAKLLR